ncbi:hypothetical protein [Paucibacter sp. DJ2R-2]|uniref:hypothetical protein n=1 Tax=Paucibacter sp. DJ2R-2 TaxID=2893558 RepID=UPI0021E4C517|nr:hypothetical protein [Paucibacter sp. DJ2R-2]MCV2421793.1 hypothetical protein [Paucibacter sp. DJ4R-1]MCV2438498.1 hypothetical protein [Paucibacter sp. DJ2R-2]
MDRFVFYSKPKLVASLAPMFVIAAALFWIGLKSGVLMILAASWALVVVALLLKMSPFDRPLLEFGSAEISFGPGLATKVPLSSIKYAKSGGSSPNAWPGNVRVLLEMEARVTGGQRHHDQKVIQLFCVDATPEDIAKHINALVGLAGRHDG